MSYLSININFNEGTLCEEISFSEPGEQSYVKGSIITLSDTRLWRDRDLIVRNVNYTEDEIGGLITTVSGFSTEYKYTRKAPDCDISFFTMTAEDQASYMTENPYPDSKVYIRTGDQYGSFGWSMHSIVEKIVIEWMGLTDVENTLPDFWVGDFSISIGSTFFEAITGLISTFEPLIVLSGSTLYVLERNGAGTLMSFPLTPSGASRRSVDTEYMPIPGCIRVEGQEGQYREDKDPTVDETTLIKIGESSYSNHSGTVVAPDGSSEVYVITETRTGIGLGESVLTNRTQKSTLTDVLGYTSYFEISADIVYTWSQVIESETETCKTKIGEAIVTYSIISTAYEHDLTLHLKGQVTSKQELYIYDSDDGSYTKYDARDYKLSGLEACESAVLIMSEVRTSRYSRISSETYGVDTIIATKMWNIEEEEWQTSYTFEHDIVEAGGQQHLNGGGGADGPEKTMQVYAGDCPLLPTLTVKDEPPLVFSINTPDWNSIEDCYTYLSALVSYEFQAVQASVPIVDPLPLMAVFGLGSIIESGIIGYNYIKGYTINIDSNGYTTELALEARRA
ncbi:hypothetical protein KAR91_75310 [Candidatus Pacearchaeota archaeon]|nr:hypothetical protein [Candidatus Pacearchaeota archaeon]